MLILEVHRGNNSIYSLFLEMFYNHYESRVWWCIYANNPRAQKAKAERFGVWASLGLRGVPRHPELYGEILYWRGLVIQPIVNETEAIPLHLWLERMNSVWCVYVLIDHALKHAQCLTCIWVCWTHRLYCTENHAKRSPRILPQCAWGRAWRVVSNFS